ncbi:hypothetical protein SLS62_010368 [Diatrype stigma]|uniref:Uncharacterized protein n=1 Tax=Diatrype stigma TaxID=117547 RepID=A0AAN9UA47_9PEZI
MFNIPEEIMDCMPKRDRCVVEGDGGPREKMETYWGLVAREKRSFLRVGVYSAALMAPSVAVAFGWLFGWGHAGDLQNATVLAMFCMGLLTIVWGVAF